jgi:type I restriction enzyme S subunit
MKVAATSVEQLHKGGRRLDASYHASGGVKALRFIWQWAGQPAQPAKATSRVLRERGQMAYETRRLDVLEEVCVPGGIFIPSRFKRIFVDDPEHGAPYLTGSLILQAHPLAGAKLLSYRFTQNMDELALRERMILVTCSGTIGNAVYVNANFEGAVGSPDLLRIVANPEKIPPGYLYAFLSSPLGGALIEQKTYGAVVPHIEAHHVTDLPIPRLDSATEEHVHELIEKAAMLRVQALDSKDEALSLLASLFHIDLSHLATQNPLVVPTSRLNWRLEAAYHAVREAVEDIFRTPTINLVPIGDLMLDMFYLGKLHRVFVDDPQNGVPLLSIADAQRAKLWSEKFVSKTQSRNVEQAMLRKGWILVSRTGTPGLVVYVRREMIGMAGTDHLVRLVPNEANVFPGYLYATLSSVIGQCLLVGSVHGSVQLQLPPEYIAQIEVPILSLRSQKPIHDLVESYGEALTQASELEDEAQAILAEALGLKTDIPTTVPVSSPAHT